MNPPGDAILRILDANLNRAREALRTIEDYARFVHDDADAAATAKALRHHLREIAGHFEGLLAARASEADVGRTTKLSDEAARRDANDVAAAAFARGGEALRCIGEYAKPASPTAAGLAEQVRYELYALEPRILLRGARRAGLRAAGLYVIITEQFCRADWRQTATAVLQAGCTCVQLREKALSDRELLARARWLRDLTKRHQALLVINDRPDIARLCQADGVHVGQDDLSVAEARRIAGADVLVGKSTHDLRQFEAALAESPDYIAVGPMFPTRTKPDAAAAGPELLHSVRSLTALPLVAIGGIGPEHSARLAAAGADALCVCSAVVSAGDPAAVVARLLHAARQRPGGTAAPG